MTNERVAWARELGQRLLEEQERRRSQTRKEQGLLEDVRREPANRQRKQAGDERVERVSFRAEAVDELPVEAVVPLGH